MSTRRTPGVVEEFLDLKAETDADLLAMQVGTSTSSFADDARAVGDALDLKVSEKSSHGSAYPMAGVPVDDLTPYSRRSSSAATGSLSPTSATTTPTTSAAR